MVKGFLAPPISVPRLPIEHPYAMLNMLTIPKLLFLGVIFMAIRIDVTIGKNIAATPCSGIINDRNVQEIIIPKVNSLGFFSKKLRNFNAF